MYVLIKASAFRTLSISCISQIRYLSVDNDYTKAKHMNDIDAEMDVIKRCFVHDKSY